MMDPNVKYQVATLLGVGGFGGVLAYWLRSRVDYRTKEEDLILKAKNAVLEAQAVPLALLRGELEKREHELTELRTADRQDRDQYRALMSEFKNAVVEISADLKALREEERTGRAKLYERVDQVDDRLLVIETRLEKRNGTT